MARSMTGDESAAQLRDEVARSREQVRTTIDAIAYGADAPKRMRASLQARMSDARDGFRKPPARIGIAAALLLAASIFAVWQRRR